MVFFLGADLATGLLEVLPVLPMTMGLGLLLLLLLLLLLASLFLWTGRLSPVWPITMRSRLGAGTGALRSTPITMG